MRRTHNCGELRISDVGKKVILNGFLENVREVSSSLAFVVLRDFYGSTQVVVDTAEGVQNFKKIGKESTVEIAGEVRERSSKNPKMVTGDIEIVFESVEVLGECIHQELPFQIAQSREADESARLKYRYLDLRNPEMRDRIKLRSDVIFALREAMIAEGFLEIQTPILTASSPEGARDYLVPSRNHRGKFYALPQAPQQFKQILMASGIDRYFQIAPCFRDEDARADRTPGEFYQLDMEMAFASQEDVFAVLERVLPPIFSKYGKHKRASKAPFKRLAYEEAMERYGSDKPDLRIKLEARDVSGIMGKTEFEPFRAATVKAVVVENFRQSRKFIDNICKEVEIQTAEKAYWFRLNENSEFTGGISKFLGDVKEELEEALGLKADSCVFLSSGVRKKAQNTAGVIIKKLGKALPELVDEEQYEFCWIVDFPMYEIGEESGELEFSHNPFSMPMGGMEAILKAKRGEADPTEIKAYQYDLVCNGIELSSGAVRNHSPKLMIEAFELVGLDESDVIEKFPAMYNAFTYGAPPHAGIAPGVDRMIMLLLGDESIREVIAFPMNKNAQDLMMNAPSCVTDKQLDELGLIIKAD